MQLAHVLTETALVYEMVLYSPDSDCHSKLAIMRNYPNN